MKRNWILSFFLGSAVAVSSIQVFAGSDFDDSSSFSLIGDESQFSADEGASFGGSIHSHQAPHHPPHPVPPRHHPPRPAPPRPVPPPHRPPRPIPPPPVPRESACFYENTHYSGHAFCLFPGEELANLYYHGYNDAMSSIRIPYGAVVQVCDNAYFSGRCYYLDYSTPTLYHIYMNDTISSVRVFYR